MPQFTTKRRVPFRAADMFAVVADVERYPEFLPLCEALRITKREDNGDLTNLVATMAVGAKGIHESFTTAVALNPASLTIGVRYLDGPFSRLANDWRFEDVPDGSIVHFFIDYEFRSMMLSLLVGAAFEKAVKGYSEAFEARARKLYKPVSQQA